MITTALSSFSISGASGQPIGPPPHHDQCQHVAAFSTCPTKAAAAAGCTDFVRHTARSLSVPTGPGHLITEVHEGESRNIWTVSSSSRLTLSLWRMALISFLSIYIEWGRDCFFGFERWFQLYKSIDLGAVVRWSQSRVDEIERINGWATFEPKLRLSCVLCHPSDPEEYLFQTHSPSLCMAQMFYYISHGFWSKQPERDPQSGRHARTGK